MNNIPEGLLEMLEIFTTYLPAVGLGILTYLFISWLNYFARRYFEDSMMFFVLELTFVIIFGGSFLLMLQSIWSYSVTIGIIAGIPTGLIVETYERHTRTNISRKMLQFLKRTPSDIQRFDPKILGIAKDYGGVITKSVVVYELQTSLEVAGKSLERFVKEQEARKINTGTLTLYDFPSARTHLSKIDNIIVEILRDNIRGMSRNELLQATGLTIEPLDASLKRLETLGITVYDKVPDEYKLKGITIHSTTK